MTASSVDIFPCRVQLMGLPPSASNSLASTNTFVRPSIAKIHGISRNLFGSPDRDEMKSLYQQEAERIRSYVLQRYNFDTKSLKPTNEKEQKKQPTDKTHTSQTTLTPEMQPTQIPTAIEKELRHNGHLLGKRHSLNKPLSVSKRIKGQTSNGNFRNIARRCNEFSSSLSHAVERQKPYRRQSLLKETFNIRKSRVWKKKNGGHRSNSEPIILENSHRNLDILQLSQHLNVQQRTCDVQDKELRTCNNIVSHQHAEIEENRSRIINCGDNCTTLSLQLVVSTQNTS